ncbi:MAG: hypothetical protein ABI433_11020 [Burkholderiaceae bacterium]
MSTLNPLDRAIESVGLAKLSRELKVSHQAIRKWQRAGRLPRTEWTGETDYSQLIENITAGEVPRAALLAKWPAAEAKAA